MFPRDSLSLPLNCYSNLLRHYQFVLWKYCNRKFHKAPWFKTWVSQERREIQYRFWIKDLTWRVFSNETGYLCWSHKYLHILSNEIFIAALGLSFVGLKFCVNNVKSANSKRFLRLFQSMFYYHHKVFRRDRLIWIFLKYYHWVQWIQGQK